jgi:hypothetical protein
MPTYLIKNGYFLYEAKPEPIEELDRLKDKLIVVEHDRAEGSSIDISCGALLGRTPRSIRLQSIDGYDREIVGVTAVHRVTTTIHT